MANFADLLNKPIDDVKRPPSLPAGTYYGTIKNYEPGESNEKKTPFIRFHLNLTHVGDDIEPAELEGIDLSKKQLRRDFFLTADAEWRLKEFLESCSIDTKGKTWAVLLPETVGAAVMIDVIQRPNKDRPTEPPFNEVRDLKGAK